MEQKPDAAKEVRQVLRTLRIIVFALAAGLAIYLGYVLTTEPGDARQPIKLWLYMAIFAGVALAARLVVPGVMFRSARRQIALGTWQPNPQNDAAMPKTDEGQLMAAFQAKTIMAVALLQGAGFANVYAYSAERQPASLAISLVLLLMIIAHFPLRFWLDGWLDAQKRWLDEERSLRPTVRHEP